MIAVGVLAVLLALAVAARAGTDRGQASVSASDAVAAYRVVYEVDVLGQPRARQEVAVQRPFHSRETTTDGGGIVSEIVSNGRGQWTYERGREPSPWLQLGASAARASADFAAGAVLESLVEIGSAETRGHERHAGRPCRVVRTGSPLGSTPSAPERDSDTDVCVDETGLVLAERWHVRRELVSSRQAVEVEVEPTFDEEVFAAPAASERAHGLRVPMGSAEASKPLRFEAPDGYRRAGAHHSLSPDGRVRSVWLFVDGPDLIEYEQGAGSIDDLGAPARTIDIGGLRGEVHLGFRSSQLVLEVGDAETVVLRSADPDRLAELARRLRTTGAPR